MAICNVSWTFGIFYDHLVHFSDFGIMYQKNLVTLLHIRRHYRLI
jgi:hypothetical protein